MNTKGEKSMLVLSLKHCVLQVWSRQICFFFKAGLFVSIKEEEIVGDLKDYVFIVFDEEINLESKWIFMESACCHKVIKWSFGA